MEAAACARRLMRLTCPALIFAVAACSTGDGQGVTPQLVPGHRPAADSDEAGLWMAMDKVEARLRTSGRLVEDPRLVAYVRKLVCELAGAYCGDIRVYGVRTPLFNATMAPNGFMEVWSGLILRARNEAQLAFVLGHYQRRHTVKFWRDAQSKTDILVYFKLLAAVAGVGYVGNIAEIVTLASIFAHSRDNEREADLAGFRMMTEAGYDPYEASKMWQALEAEREAADVPGQLIFFSTHPPSSERIRSLEDLAQEASPDEAAGETGVTASWPRRCAIGPRCCAASCVSASSSAARSFSTIFSMTAPTLGSSITSRVSCSECVTSPAIASGRSRPMRRPSWPVKPRRNATARSVFCWRVGARRNGRAPRSRPTWTPPPKPGTEL